MSAAVAQPASAIDKSGKKKIKRGGPPRMNWATYLHKIKGQKHPELGMASDAMYVLNGIVEDYKERMILESYKSAESLKGGTIKSKHARMAAALLLDGQLLKHTVAEGEKTLAKYIEVEEALAAARAAAKKDKADKAAKAGK